MSRVKESMTAEPELERASKTDPQPSVTELDEVLCCQGGRSHVVRADLIHLQTVNPTIHQDDWPDPLKQAGEASVWEP